MGTPIEEWYYTCHKDWVYYFADGLTIIKNHKGYEMPSPNSPRISWSPKDKQGIIEYEFSLPTKLEVIDEANAYIPQLQRKISYFFEKKGYRNISVIHLLNRLKSMPSYKVITEIHYVGKDMPSKDLIEEFKCLCSYL